jgi:WD40 repeat protein/tRNA A-37 threonylcarbamoyl transferase component Bud32
MASSESREDWIVREARKRLLAERAVFLDGACAGDNALRQRIETLLAAAEAGDTAATVPEAHGSTVKVSVPTGSDEAIGQTLGRYKLLEKIGEGGFGAVYVAEQKEPVKRRVALKIIKLGMDTRQVVARFEAERQALALMDHPNIAKVLDGGSTESGRPYFVMELVRGVRITDYCDQERLSTKDRLELFIKVCQAIQHAHQKGIIHRDIKPSNILVTLHDGTPTPKVIDFGIAKATQQELTEKTIYTQLQQFIGTPAYMSPEQAEMSGLDIDTRSDIYSLGVLLYELLTGSKPFDTEELIRSGLDEMRKIIREREPVRPSTRVAQQQGLAKSQIVNRKSQIPSDLDWIVMKCLEKDRTRRYETANGLAADLKRHLTNEPVTARQPSRAYRFQKAFRRNRLAFSAAATVIAALVAGIGVSTWELIRATRAEREQNELRQVAVKALNGEKEQRAQAESERERADVQAQKAIASQEQSRRLLYASDMNLAQQALRLNNVGKARRLLDRHRPKPGEPDLRGWEWRYLWQLTRSSALATLTNRTVRGFSVSFSADGSRLAVGWFDGHVDLWDVRGRRLVRALTDQEYRYPGRVAFSHKGLRLAATSEPKTVTLYELDSGRQSVLWKAQGDGLWDVRDLSFSADDSKVIVYAEVIPSQRRDASLDPARDEISVVDVASAEVEFRCPALNAEDNHFGAAQLSPDNRKLYAARSDHYRYNYNIECIDLVTHQPLWRTELQRDEGLTSLAVSPDGQVLASASGYEDPGIRIWDTATGKLRFKLDGHSAWVCKLAFSKDGRHLVSAAADQSIRIWDTSNWTESRVLRGHTDEVHAVAISESAHLIASASKDGDLMLWDAEAKTANDGYQRFADDLYRNQVTTLDGSRVLLAPDQGPPEVVDLKTDSHLPLAEIGFRTNLLGCFETNIICHWDGTNQIQVHELRGDQLITLGAVALNSGTRPRACGYHPKRQLLAWTEEAAPMSVHLVGLTALGRRVELKSDLMGLDFLYFNDDATHLVGYDMKAVALRVWNIETGQIVTSIAERVNDFVFADGGRILVVSVGQGRGHEIRFYNLERPERAPRRVPVKHFGSAVALSRTGLAASASGGGEVRLFDPVKGELIETVHGHLNAIFGLAFSPDGRRLVSSSGGREAVKLWDVETRQELLTFSGAGSALGSARWTVDGDVILVGTPWQAWRAPSWQEIAAAEAKEKFEGDGR